MKKAIYFDMDGTIADLYGIDTWLSDILAENERPYKEAKVLVNMNLLAKRLHKLQENGYKLGIISWTAKNATETYNEKVSDCISPSPDGGPAVRAGFLERKDSVFR